MKRKLFLATLGLTSALLITARAQAADDDTKSSSSGSASTQGASGKGISSTSGQSQKFTRVSQLTHQSLKNTSGESLGQINDLIVDPTTGRLEFAVIALQGGEQTGKLTAIPWTLVRASGEGQMQNLTANIEKSKLSTAQTFERSQWPNMSQENWGQQIYSHYGLQWQDRASAGGRVSIGGAEAGTGVSSDRSKDADNGTAPDGKGTFKSDKSQNPSDTSTSPSSTSPSSSSTSPSKDRDSSSGLK